MFLLPFVRISEGPAFSEAGTGSGFSSSGSSHKLNGFHFRRPFLAFDLDSGYEEGCEEYPSATWAGVVFSSEARGCLSSSPVVVVSNGSVFGGKSDAWAAVGSSCEARRCSRSSPPVVVSKVSLFAAKLLSFLPPSNESGTFMASTGMGPAVGPKLV